MLSPTLYLTKMPQAATGRERLPFMEQGTSFIHQNTNQLTHALIADARPTVLVSHVLLNLRLPVLMLPRIDYVNNNPSAFVDAYFQFNALRVYT